MQKIKRIGVATNGGDCAGLNAAIMAIVKRAAHFGWEVIGFENGAEGLTGSAPNRKLTVDMPWNSLIREGSSFLGAFSKANWKFNNKKELESTVRDREGAEIAKVLKKLKIDGLITTGGNGGTFYTSGIAATLGIPYVGIPKTLDNDTPGTELSIGFQSTIDECVSDITKVYWTAKGHRRIIITEVMGKEAGHLAMHAGLASNADIILIPELPYTVDGIIRQLKKVKAAENRDYFLIVVAEGAGAEKNDTSNVKIGNAGEYLNEKLEERGWHSRTCQLGHLQRGAIPTAQDLILAQEMGSFAVDTMNDMLEPQQKMVALLNGRISAVSLKKEDEIGTQYLNLQSDIVRTARELGIYIGE